MTMADDARTARRDAYQSQRWLLSGTGEKIIIDVGAYVGDTPVKYASLFPEATIHALEPFPATFAELERHTTAVPNIRRHQLAAAATSGPRTLFVNGFDPTHSLLPRPTGSKRYFPARAATVDRVQVQTITLDDFCRREGIEFVDLLKLDVQGAELEVLRGASNLLEKQGVGVIFTEVAFVPHYQGAPLMHELWRYLADVGYTLYDLVPELHGKDGQLRYGDAIFVSSALRRDVIDAADGEP